MNGAKLRCLNSLPLKVSSFLSHLSSNISLQKKNIFWYNALLKRNQHSNYVNGGDFVLVANSKLIFWYEILYTILPLSQLGRPQSSPSVFYSV